MAITDFATYKTLVKNPIQQLSRRPDGLSANSGRMISLWTGSAGVNDAGVAPSTAAVPTATLAGAIKRTGSDANYVNAAASTTQRIIQTIVGTTGTFPCGFWLCDRLSHQGGLVGNIDTTQTTNLPTAALTRYTTGVGVFAVLEIYTAIGATGTTFTASYTNQVGTAGQTSIAQDIGTSTYNALGRLLPMPLQSGDTGVRAVASVTLLATTGTAGNLGVTLYKPLLFIPQPVLGSKQLIYDGLIGLGGMLPDIVDDACLWLVAKPNASNTSGHVISVHVVKDA